MEVGFGVSPGSNAADRCKSKIVEEMELAWHGATWNMEFCFKREGEGGGDWIKQKRVLKSFLGFKTEVWN